jgi:hypothetical protein
MARAPIEVTAQEVDSLVRRLDEQRLFLQSVLKEIRATKHGPTWDPVELSKTLREIVKSAHIGSEIRAIIGKLQPVIDDAASVALLELESDIRELCVARGWRVDGQWPTLIVERAVEVKLNQNERTVTVGGAKIPGTTKHLIEDSLDGRIAQLIPRGYKGERFLAELAQAYDRASNRAGGEIPILHVYRALVVDSQSARFWKDARRTAYSELTSEQFRARLSSALESGLRTAPDGRELRLLPPIDPKDAVFLYQPAENRFGYVGRIEFRKPE